MCKHHDGYLDVWSNLFFYSQTCLQRSVTNVAFVDRWPLFGASESNYPMFTGRIKTGLCGQETTIRRCPYEQV